MGGNVVTVLRGDKVANIPEDGLRNGDVVLLQAGDLVPADLKLLEATGLEVDDWELTGEIVPAAKQVGAEAVFIYRGSRVTRGHGKGLVVATGKETEYAEILKQPWERAGRKPPALVKGRYLILPLLLLPPCLAAWRQSDQPVLVVSLTVLAAVLIVLLQNGALFKCLLTAAAARRLARGTSFSVISRRWTSSATSTSHVLTRLFQQSNHTVAMVGDGANDVIALRAADVGISFVAHSSPLARRVSKVLINDVADLLPLIRSARSLRRWVRFLTLLRVAGLLALFMGLCAWMLNWL